MPNIYLGGPVCGVLKWEENELGNFEEHTKFSHEYNFIVNYFKNAMQNIDGLRF